MNLSALPMIPIMLLTATLQMSSDTTDGAVPTEVEVVLHGADLHELGHAWTHQNLDGATRHAFMDRRGSTRWNDHEQPDYTEV